MSICSNIFESIDVFGRKLGSIHFECIPENVLGYSLYQEQERWIDACYNSGEKVVLLLASRWYGKTDVIIVFKVVDLLLKNPSLKFIISTKERSRLKSIIASISYYLQRAGKKGKFTDYAIQLYENIGNKQPSVVAITPSTYNAKGMHADYLLADDIIADKDEFSAVEQRNIKNFFDESFNIANKIIILGQPVFENDLFHYIESLTLKAKKEGLNIAPKVIRSFRGSIPELDRDLDTIRAFGGSERHIQKNYYGNFILDGTYPFSNLKVEDFKIGNNCMACIDTAFGGGDNVGVSVGYEKNGKYYCQLYELPSEINLNVLIALMKKHNVYKCYVENVMGATNGGSLVRDLKQLDTPCIVKGFKDMRNKKLRIEQRISWASSRLVINGDIHNVLAWTRLATKDDVIDSLASLVNFMNGNKDNVKVY